MKESAVASILLALIIACGFFVRLQATSDPVWLDECHTAWVVDTDSVAVAISRAADGNQPPVYFVLVWCLTRLFGLSEFSLRLVSVLAGSALVAVASLWIQKVTRRHSPGILVAALIAFDGQFIFYACEARSYALIQLLGIFQAIAFWRITGPNFEPESESQASEPEPTRWLVAWTLLSILLFFTHYTSIWILVAEAMVLMLLMFLHRRFSIKLACAWVTVVAAALAGWSNVSTVLQRRENWSSVSSRQQLWIDVEPWLVHWVLIPVGFAFAGFLLSLIQGATEDESQRQRPPWLLWVWIAAWASVGPLGIGMADWLEVAPMALVRYSIVCWVAMALFAGLCLSPFSRRSSRVVGAIILACSLLGNWWIQDLARHGPFPPFRSEDWVTTVCQLAESNGEEPVFQFADVIEDIDALSIDDQRFQDYLLFPILGAAAIDGRSEQLARIPITALPTWNPQFLRHHLDAIRQAGGCWFVYRGNLDYGLILPGELEQQLGQSIEFKFIPNESFPASNVHLIRIRLNKQGRGLPVQQVGPLR